MATAVSAQEVTETRLCRTPGCTNDANRRYDRGTFSGLCEERCIPAARKAASERSIAAHAKAPRPSPNGRAPYADGGSLSECAAAVVPAARELEKRVEARREAKAKSDATLADAQEALRAFNETLEGVQAAARELVGVKS